jgi:hypothetical protein
MGVRQGVAMDSLKVSLGFCHTQPHRALRAVTTETVVSEVAAHDAVFYPLGYPTSYAYSKMDHVRDYRCCKPRLTSTSTPCGAPPRRP